MSGKLGPGILLTLCGHSDLLKAALSQVRCWAGPMLTAQVAVVHEPALAATQCCDVHVPSCPGVWISTGVLAEAGAGLKMTSAGPDVTTLAVAGELVRVPVTAADQAPVVCPAPAAVLTSVTPNPLVAGSGNTTLTLKGTGFVAGAKIHLGVPHDATFVDSQTLTVVFAPSSATTIPVTVTNPGAAASNAVSLVINNPPPAVTGIAPAAGAPAGGTAVVVTGTGLTGATGVTFGGTAGTAFSVVNATTVNVTSPAKAAGAVDVIVQHPAGNATSPTQFTYA